MAEQFPDAPPEFPERGPGGPASHLGKIQTALLGRITPSVTLACAPAALMSPSQPIDHGSCPNRYRESINSRIPAGICWRGSTIDKDETTLSARYLQHRLTLPHRCTKAYRRRHAARDPVVHHTFGLARPPTRVKPDTSALRSV